MTALALPEAPAGPVLGSIEPRIWTPPLRELTPETSYGFRAIRFARDTLRFPFRPWQEWLVIHAGELLPDGAPRFRVVIVIVARQQGKSTVPIVLAPYWQFAESRPLTVIASKKLDYAHETWQRSIRLVERAIQRDDQDARDLRSLVPHRRSGVPHWKREANGQQEAWSVEGCKTTIAAANDDCCRSLTVDRLFLDEWRQQQDYGVWEAAEPACSPWDAQIWIASNAGNALSKPLNEQREDAIRFIETGVGDPGVGLFEWSAPRGSDPEDLQALAMANPELNRSTPERVLLAKARTAKARGGEALASFLVNYMCIPVTLDEPAIDPDGWKKGLQPGSLDGFRDRVALVLDVAPDERHATLVAAAKVDAERCRVEPVAAWSGAQCMAKLRRELPALVRRARPKVFGWFPNSPAAALTAELRARKGRTDWPPPGVVVEEIKGEAAAACMGFASRVAAGQVLHSDDPLLNDHVGGAQKLVTGNTWVFSRKGGGHCTAAYGAAGAVHLALTLPSPLQKPTGTVRVLR